MVKKLIAICFLVAVMLVAQNAYSADSSVTSTVTATVSSVFSASFFNDATSMVYPTGGPLMWTNVNPAEGTIIKPDGNHTGKSTLGVVCLSNINATWCLKVGVTSATLQGKMKYYMSQPVDRNTGGLASGGLGNGTPADGADWPLIGTTAAPTKVYTSGTGDKNNAPYGTLCSLTLGLNPTGLATGVSHTGTVTYTMTTTL